MPEDALSHRDPDEPHWGLTEELLAQMVEEVSVLAADKRRKEPRSVMRPWEKKRKPVTGIVTTGNGGIHATGLDGMLAAAQTRGAVTLGG